MALSLGPYRASGALTNAKLPGCPGRLRDHVERRLAGAGAQQSHQAVGWLDGGLTAPFEKFHHRRREPGHVCALSTVLSWTRIAGAGHDCRGGGPGGHHFGTTHTQARFRNEHYQSRLADRRPFDAWAEGAAGRGAAFHLISGSGMLAESEPPPLDEGIQNAGDYGRRRRDPAEVKPP